MAATLLVRFTGASYNTGLSDNNSSGKCEVELDGMEWTYSCTGAVGLGRTSLDGVVALRDSVVEFGAADHSDGLVVRMEGIEELTEQRLDLLTWEHKCVLKEFARLKIIRVGV